MYTRRVRRIKPRSAMECGGGEDDEYAGPCCLRPGVLAGAFCIIAVLFAGAFIGIAVVSGDVDDLTAELSRVHVQQYTLDGSMRPQFYTYNQTGEWSVPSGIVMPADGRMYARSWCTFSENTRTAQVRYVVQATAETSSAQLSNWVEFRFEVPYGLPIGVQPGDSTAEYTRCPMPQCGTADYRAGIGAAGGFTNAEAAFVTVARVAQNRTRIAPVPVTCGCSQENPPRMSCTFPGSGLVPIDGPLDVTGEFWYTTADVTVPPPGTR
jgi:hypothetical protein